MEDFCVHIKISMQFVKNDTIENKLMLPPVRRKP